MEEKKTYDERRRLEDHKANYAALKPEEKEKRGNCKLCADVTCLCNVTEKAVLAALEKDGPDGKNVEQFTCPKSKEDTLIRDSLKSLE